MNRITALSIALGIAFSLRASVVQAESPAATLRPIVVLKSKSIGAYDEAYAGVRASLGTTPLTFDLGGHLEGASQILARIRAASPAAVIAIGARAAQIARDAKLGVPLVHCLVLHPERLAISSTKVVGVPLWVPARSTLSVLRHVLRSVRRIGLLGDPRQNAAAVRDIRRAAAAQRVHLSVARVGGAQHLPAALEQMLPRIEAVWLLPDASIASDEAFRFVLLHAFRRGIPVVAFSRSFVQAGALFALEPDYRAMGAAAANLAREAILGPQAGAAQHSPVATPPRLILNVTTARRLGIVIPTTLARRAQLVE